PVLRLECFNPSILKTEPPPVTCAQSIWLPSFPLIRAAFSRGSGFVQWLTLDEAESSSRKHNRHRECAACHALAIGAVAGTDDQWCLGELVADRTTLATTRLRKVHWTALPALSCLPRS